MIVPIGADMQVSLYSLAGAHLVADVAGRFTSDTATPGDDGLFVPITPQRILDTRDAFDVAPPAGAEVDRRSGQTIPNAVIVGLGDAHLRAYTSSGGHLVIDIAGWFTG